MLREGYLQKESRWFRHWHRRFVTLSRDGCLRTYTRAPPGPDEQGDAANIARPVLTDELDVSGGRCGVASTTPSSLLRGVSHVQFGLFASSASGQTFWFKALSEEERRAWLAALTSAAGIAPQSPFGALQHAVPAATAPPTVPRGPPAEASPAPQAPPACGGVEASGAAPPQPAAGGAWLYPEGSAAGVTCAGVKGATTADGNRSAQGGPAPSPPVSVKGKGKAGCKSSPPPPPLPLSSKGKGKAAPPPPAPPKGKGRGKSKASSGLQGPSTALDTPRTSAPLPIGRRVQLKEIRVNPSAQVLSLPSSSGAASSWEPMANAMNLRRGGSPPLSVNLMELVGQFAQVAVPKQTRKLSEPRVELLPNGNAQNLAIVLRSIDIHPKQLALALKYLDFDLCTLDEEQTNRLLAAWPSQDLLQPMLNYALRVEALCHEEKLREVEKLRDIERQVLPLAIVPRMGARLRLMTLAGSLDARVAEIMSQMDMLTAVCRRLQTSSILRDIVRYVVVVFNIVNFGTLPDNVELVGDEIQLSHDDRLRFVDVRSMIRLKETKAVNGDFEGYHMLHYTLKQLLQQRPHLRLAQFDEELAGLHEACGVTLQALRAEVEKMRGDRLFIHKELRDHRGDYADSESEGGDADRAEEEQEQELSAAPAAPTGPPASVLPSDGEAPTPASVLPPDGEAPTPAAPCASAPVESSPPALTLPASATVLAQGPDPAAASSADEESPTSPGFRFQPPLERRRTVFGLLVDGSKDFFGFAESWIRGDEVVGNQVRDRAPPDLEGWLWACRMSDRWIRSWCEVRGHLLVVFRQRGLALGASYFVLPGADVRQFHAEGASARARELAQDVPLGFELFNEASRQFLRLSADRRSDRDRWFRLLGARSRAPGAGMLEVYRNGRIKLGAGRRRCFCWLVGNAILMFARPRDRLEGEPPEDALSLNSTVIRLLAETGASRTARRFAETRSTHCGFEVERNSLVRGTDCWQFICKTRAEEAAWLEAIQTQRARTAFRPEPSPSLTVGSPTETYDIASDGECEEDVQQVRTAAQQGASPVRSQTEIFDIASDSDVEEVALNVAEGRDEPREPLELSPVKEVLEEVVAVALPGSASGVLTPSAESNGSGAGGGAGFFALDDHCDTPEDLLHQGASGEAAAASSSQPLGSSQGDEDGGGFPLTEDSGQEPPSMVSSAETLAILASVQKRGVIDRLEELDLALRGSIETLSSAIDDAETDCRALLGYFGLEAPPTSMKLSELTNETAVALGDFASEMKVAWRQLERRPSGPHSSPALSQRTPEAFTGFPRFGTP